MRPRSVIERELDAVERECLRLCGEVMALKNSLSLARERRADLRRELADCKED